MISAEHDFDNSLQLASALAASVAQDLRQCLDKNSSAVLAVSGGTTPILFFEVLAVQKLNWEQVTVTLVDERQVDEDNPRSNAALVRQHLLTHEANLAKFVPLYHNEKKAGELKLDVVVLGMGGDGHTASFFPAADNLAEALNPSTPQTIIALAAPTAGEPRLSFSYQALRQAQVTYLHIQGTDKKHTLSQALQSGNIEDMPIRAFLRDTKPLIIYWCP